MSDDKKLQRRLAIIRSVNRRIGFQQGYAAGDEKATGWRHAFNRYYHGYGESQRRVELLEALIARQDPAHPLTDRDDELPSAWELACAVDDTPSTYNHP